MKNFLDTHKLYQKGNTNNLSDVDKLLPKELLSILNELNTNSYANGFLNFIEIKKFQHYFSLWKLNPNECFPFIKLAFGHLIFYHQSQYKVLNPVHNCIDILGEKGEIDFVMNIMLCDRIGLENSFFIDIYEQLSEKLGSPNINEIYAFVPAINLGGSRDPENVHKLNMDTQMMILSQI